MTLAPPEAPLSDTLPDHEPDPLRTLGWGVILWCHTWLIQPDGDRAGEPWRFTPAQIHFILWFYAVDEDGRWLHNRAAIRRSKGTGKSPFVAALSLAELIGPVRFNGWESTTDAPGFEILVGKPVAFPWVQIAATAESQTVNTMAMVSAMVPPRSRVRDHYALDPGKTRVYTANGGRLEVISASAHAAEGARSTFAILDETEWWLASNGGHSLYGVMRRNLGKLMGRSIETCNAFVPGQDSIAEKTHTTYLLQLEGRTHRAGLLYDSLEGSHDIDESDPESLKRGLARAYSCSPWVDVDWILGEYLDPSNAPGMAARFYLNWLVAGEDAWISPQEWTSCQATDEREPLQVGDMITLGFDGSIRDDATALVAVRVHDGLVSLLGCWEPPPDREHWQVPRGAVDAAVDKAFANYTVAAAYCDPAHWQDYLDKWQAEYGDQVQVRASGSRPFELWTGGGSQRRIVAALERFREAVLERRLSHDGNPTLARHVGNAVVRYGRSGASIAKEFPDSRRKIDAAMAATLAYEARNDCIAAGVDPNAMFVPVRVY